MIKNMQETRPLTPEIKPELTSEISIARMSKQMGSYLTVGDFDLALSLIFPPVDKITPQGNVCVLTAKETKFPVGVTMAEFFEHIDRVGGSIGSYEMDEVNHEHLYVITASHIVYLIEEDGENYKYTLVTKDDVTNLPEDEYLLIA